MATQDECRVGILLQWKKLKPPRRRSGDAERQMFIIWLQKNRPDLLDFESRDKWRIVNGWLVEGDD